MLKCPRCKGYLNWNFEHRFNTSYVYYTCNCGYDTRDVKVTYGITTETTDNSVMKYPQVDGITPSVVVET